MQYNLDDNVSIIDKKTNNVIVAGRISIIKDSITCINRCWMFFTKHIKKKVCYLSFDSKYFFNVKSKRFIVIKSNDEKTFDSSTINNYKNYSYNNAKSFDADIYIENTKNELDKEVVRLVNLLNKIPNLMTSGSCSGHNVDNLWVSMVFTDIKTIKLFASIFYNDNFYDKFMLLAKNNRKQTTPNGVELCITSLNKGKKAYKDAEDLCDYLEIYINTIINKL